MQPPTPFLKNAASLAFAVFLVLVLFSAARMSRDPRTRAFAPTIVVPAAESVVVSVVEEPIVEEAPAALPVQTALLPEEAEISAVTFEDHIPAPGSLHGLYLSSWSAGSAKTVDRILRMLFENPKLNTVVIDIKDASGKLSYQPVDPELAMLGVGTNRISDLPGLITKLHQKGVYVIGRLSVFQDPFYAERYPEHAFKNTATGGLWRDYKGISWLRADSVPVWDYAIKIAEDAVDQGFDEINVDYVRFPSDGPLAQLDWKPNGRSKAETIQDFFKYLDANLRSQGITLSADLFGLTLSAQDDLGIGQKLAMIAPYVDYVCPMIYPSHYKSGSYGIANPAAEPYQTVYQSLSAGLAKLAAAGLPGEKLRPWLQDFNLGATYTADMVRAQIQATEYVGLQSWLIWDPKNVYTEEAFF